MRKFIRHPSDIPIQVHLEDVVSDRKEYLSNISFGGLSFRSHSPLKAGTVIRVRIPLIRPVFETRGRVVWCRENKEYYDVGVEFIEQKDVFKARMVEQICYIEHYKREIYLKEGRRLSGEEAALEWIEHYASEFPHLGDEKGE